MKIALDAANGTVEAGYFVFTTVESLDDAICAMLGAQDWLRSRARRNAEPETPDPAVAPSGPPYFESPHEAWWKQILAPQTSTGGASPLKTNQNWPGI